MTDYGLPERDETKKTPPDSGEDSPSTRQLSESGGKNVWTLETVDPEASLDDLRPLRDVFGDTRIIGLGEATHGSREFFQLKHRLLRYLITELDIRLLGLEAHFSAVLDLNEYVVYGTGNPRELINDLYFWTWNVHSVLELIEWLRSFNTDRPVQDRVRLYGIDAQLNQGTVDRLADYLATVDPEFLGTVREELETLGDERLPAKYDEHCGNRIGAADEVLGEIRDGLQRNKDAYITASSRRSWELACQYVAVIEHSIDQKRATCNPEESRDLSNSTEASLDVRDRTMADIVDWILEFESSNRIAIWGHDAHINRVGQPGCEGENLPDSLGSYLDDRHGDDYLALGFSFGHGSFRAFRKPTTTADRRGRPETVTLEEPIPDTIDAMFAALDLSCAIVDTAAMSNKTVAESFDETQNHFSVGAMYDSQNPERHLVEYDYTEAFDIVCYLDEVTNTRPLDQ